MASILNKLGLGHSSDSSHSSSSSSSTTSGSTHSSTSAAHTSSTSGTTTTTTTGSNLAGAGTNTVNRTGYADTGAYAHTAGTGTTGYNTASTTTTTTTATHPSTTSTAAAAGTDYMTRSEERLLVGKEQVHAGVASLNKYVTTEHVSTAVPITKEHVVIEREPIAPGENIRSNIGEAHYEVALKEERAVAAKEAVAVEKVKLRKEVEHAVQNVDADLRKEHIEFGTTTEQGKTLGAAPGTAGYTNTTTTHSTTGSNIDPVANPRV